MQAIAKALGGQLTATVQMDAEDSDTARTLVAILERKAGRIIANGFPTGVEVADNIDVGEFDFIAYGMV